MSKIRLTPNASGTGTVTLTVPSTNTDRTISLPDAAGDVVTTGDTGTITASMLDGGQSGSAPAFAVRAWVNFDLSNSILPVESGNISSVVDTGVGRATVNLSTAMPDANYCVVVGNRVDSSISRNIVGGAYINTSSQFYWVTETSDGAVIDQPWNYAVVVR